jgi:hypothetical protein
MAAGATAKPANRFYVYLFLRHDGTPYYVGKGTGRRQWDPQGWIYVCPADREAA